MVAGIDFSSFAVDIVLLDDETNDAEWHRVELRGLTPFERVRGLRERFPGWTWWDDNGVYLVGIEDPHSRQPHAAKALGLVAGAIAVRLPPPLTVIQTAPVEWKRLTVGKAGASKDEVTAWARDELGHTPGTKWAQDAYDAYAIARAVRRLNQEAIDRKGAAA